MNIEKISLSTGKHQNLTDGACVMELVSYLAKEPWSDHPECASQSITSLAIWINDTGDQEHRDKLKKLSFKIINTRDHKKEPARAKIYSDFAFWCSEQAAKYAEYAAESAAESAKYAEYAAESAEYAAESAAEYAAKSAESAEYAAKSAAFRKKLYAKAIECLDKAIGI